MSRGLWPLALLLSACSTTDTDPWPDEAPLVETVGWLDEKPVTYGEVARYLRTKDPLSFSLNLEGVVLQRATLAEAEPLGVAVPPGLLMRATEQRMREWERRVRDASRKETGKEIDPALWLQRIAGVSVAEFRTWVKGHTEIEMIQDRLARYEMLTSLHVEVSLLVVKEEARARRFLGEISKGASFEDLARRHSIDATAETGGRLGHPLIHADFADPRVRKAVFDAQAGAVLGPFPTQGGDQTFFQLYQVEASHPPLRGGYEQLRRKVERSLEARPVAVGEYSRWRRRVLLRHGFEAARFGEPQ